MEKKNKDIIRFSANGRQRLILRGITETQAREWCNNPYTRKAGKYFDGFDETGTHVVKGNPKYLKYFIPTENA